MARVDYDEQAGRYDAARAAPDDARLVWVDEVRRAWPEPRGRLADVGAGTGQWAGLFVRALDVEVVGVEPSAGMRAAAGVAALPAGVSLVAGRAEALPLATGSVGALWLSAVLHHLSDLDAFAAEARRVARPGAPLLLRGFFPGLDEPDDIGALAAAAGLPGRVGYPRMFFPGVYDVFATFPSVPLLDEVLGRAGFERAAVTWVPEVLASSSAELVDRMALRADTTLASLPDADFTTGLTRARTWAAEDDATQVVAALPLLTYR